MICTKCNNELLAGAKFCPSCGAAVSASEAEKKLYCEKCGLELMKGARFCAACGGNGIARMDKPADIMAAVDLGKPSGSDSLVSAMNGSAAAGTDPAPFAMSGIPMPSNSIPTPSETGSGIAASFGGSEPAVPSFAASMSADADQAPVMPMPIASSEAAAAVKKKGNGGKIALFSILGVVLIAAAAAAIMFFTNRAAFLSTLMGKEKYATMVEGNSIKNVTDKLDIPAISNGIKTASGTFQTLYAAQNAEDLGKLGGLRGYDLSGSLAPMSYDPGFNNSYVGGGFDLETFSKEFAALLSDVYGVNSITETFNVNVKLGDSVKSMIESNTYGDINLDEMLDIINGTNINYTLTAKDGKTAVTAGTQGKITVNAKFMTDGQDVYIALPFASDKAVKITVPKGEEEFKLDAAPLELDEKELERLITECVEIYLDYYKDSAIEMENGELKAGGVTVEGKVITAEFKGGKLAKMMIDIAKHIVNDDYLISSIVDYANSLGAEIDKQEFINEALDEIENIELNDEDKLVLTTVIDRNGNVLGKSFKALYEKDVLCEISYAETADQIGIEVDDPDFDELSNTKITIDKTDDQNGSCKVKFTVEEKEISFVINYSDCRTAEFCGKKIPTGKISIGMALPEEFSDQLGKENFAAVNGAKLKLEIAADSANTLSYAMGIDVPNYGSVTFKNVVTALNDDSALNAPANVIDITGALKGDMLPGDDTYTELEKFANEIVEALKKALPESIAGEFDEYLPTGGISGGNNHTVYEYEIQYLLDEIKSDMMQANSAMNSETSNSVRHSELEALVADYMELYKEVMDKEAGMTGAQFMVYQNRYFDLNDRLIDLGVFSSVTPAGSNNSSALANQVEARAQKVGSKFSDIVMNYYNASGSQNAQDAFSDIMKASEELAAYCMQTGADDYSKCTDEQLKHIDSLLNTLESKIAAFEAQSNR